MVAESRNGNAGRALGAILIMLGVVFLAGQLLGLNLGRLGWPLFVVVPGLVLCAVALGVRAGGEGLFILGSMVTATGLILLYQNYARHWESWAYAWALIAPTSVGLGQLIYGALTGRRQLVSNGTRVASVGLALFLVFGAFFEVGLGISGRSVGTVAGYVFSGALILLGLLMLMGNLFHGRGNQAPAGPPPPAGPPHEPPAPASVPAWPSTPGDAGEAGAEALPPRER